MNVKHSFVAVGFGLLLASTGAPRSAAADDDGGSGEFVDSALVRDVRRPAPPPAHPSQSPAHPSLPSPIPSRHPRNAD